MDAVELPLPANVAVKLLAPDGFGRVGKPDNGPDSSGFGGRKASDYGSYHKGKIFDGLVFLVFFFVFILSDPWMDCHGF